MHTNAQLTQAALALVPGWLNGERRGDEWHAEHGGQSWIVNLRTGQWTCTGSNAIELYARLHGISVLEAQERLSPLKLDPIPENAPDILPHPHLGKPAATYREGNALVCRYEDGSIQRWTWREDRWAPLQESEDPWSAQILAKADHLRLMSPEVQITPLLLLREVLSIRRPASGDKKRCAQLLKDHGWIPLRNKELRWWVKRERKITISQEQAA